ISISLHNIFSYRKDDEDFYNLVHDWNKKIVIEIKPYYPLTVIFNGDEIKFKIGASDDADMRVKLHLNTMLDFAYGRENPIFGVEKGLMEMEGLGDDSELLVKFYNIFMVTMQMVAAEPNINYYELNKKTK
ncbi:MAG: SCP2 sterol-binding domain-containing protein, partial [Promethearchaeota archaeon]